MSLPFSPEDIGLPEKFAFWRPTQESAIDQLITSETRFNAVAAPTGTGKSLTYIAYALLNGGRVAVLTSTKGLQDQLLRDFGGIGLVDVRGRNNYQCSMTSEMNCEDGRYAGCGNPTCPYKVAYGEAVRAKLVVTNYTYWMLQHKYGQGLGDFDLLVLDEAHNAPDEVSSVAAVEFSTREVYRLIGTRFPDNPTAVASWSAWAKSLIGPADVELHNAQEVLKGYSHPPLSLLREVATLDRICSSLAAVACIKGDWVVETTRDGYRLEPIWPKQYAEGLLFRQIPKVVLVSATLMPKTLDMLGIPEQDRSFREYPSPFLVSRWPVIWIPTCRVNRETETDQTQKALWLSRIDQICRPRGDRKGLIHSVSYKRRDFILDHSDYSFRMLTHASGNASDVVQMFRRSQPSTGKILVSPAMATGWDFPYQDCEYQIISKIPFPDMSSVVLRARNDHDPDYSACLMVQSLEQACGRPMRAEDDRCETFVIDDNIRWVRFAYKHLFHRWWWRLYRKMDTIPSPPAKLDVNGKC